MKIYKKPKMPKVRCYYCGCEFVPGKRDVHVRETSGCSVLQDAVVACPICKRTATIEFTPPILYCRNCTHWDGNNRCNLHGTEMYEEDFCTRIQLILRDVEE